MSPKENEINAKKWLHLQEYIYVSLGLKKKKHELPCS